MRNLSFLIASSSLALGAERRRPVAERALQQPGVARVADHREARLVLLDPVRDARDQAAERLAGVGCGLDPALDRPPDIRAVDIARDAEAAGQGDMNAPAPK